MKIRKSQLSAEELDVLQTIQILNGQGRTTNNSQIARFPRSPSRTAVATITGSLRGWKLIEDVSKGSSYHWRITSAGRALIIDGETPDESPRDAELAARQRELNEQIRKQAETERRAAAGDDQAQDALYEQDNATGWTVSTFDGQRKVGEGTYTGPEAEQLASDTARKHREYGYTTRVRPAGLTDETVCCTSCRSQGREQCPECGAHPESLADHSCR
jgi:hypothetical protein